MNSKQYNKSQDQDAEKLKEIPKWTRKYAQNRILTASVPIVIVLLFSVGISFPLALTWTAFVKGKMILTGAGIALFVVTLICLIIFLRKFGGKNRVSIDQWIYGKEGTASMPEPKLTKKNKWLGFVVAVVVFICILGTYHLSVEGH